ncbi:MAG: hypothetical protein ACYC2H_01280 [Thermoplasmatota archaeon]
MSDLALELGNVKATGSLRKGAAWGGAVQQVGQIAQRTMADLAEYKEQEPFRESAVAKATAETAAAKRAAEFEVALKEAGQYDPDDAIEFLRTKGFAEEASKMLKELEQARRDGIETSVKKMDLAGKSLTHAAAVLSGVKDAVGNEAEAWTAARPKIAELVGPELAKALPEQYDPAFVERSMKWGMTTKDRLSAQAEELRNANLTGKDKRERDTHFTASLSRLLPLATSPEDWNEVIENAKGLGAPSETIAKFGTEFSPEAVAKAKAIGAPVDKTPAGPGSFDSFVESFARDRKKGASELTASELASARRTWESAGWKPEKSTSLPERISAADYREFKGRIEQSFNDQIGSADADGAYPISQEQRATAIRWRDTQLKELEALARKSGINTRTLSDLAGEEMPGDWHPPLTRQGAGNRPAPAAPPAPSSAPPVNFRTPGNEPTSSQAPSPVRLRLPNGKVKTFPSQEAADAFMQAAGFSAK